MSISQTLNNNSNASKKNFNANISPQELKNFAKKNLAAVKKYWPLILISQIPFAYTILNSRPQITKPNAKVEAKNLDVIGKKNLDQKELEKRLKSLNERFLVLQTQHAKMVKNIIAIQEKSQNSPTPNPDIVNKKNDLSIFETFEKIGEKIKSGEAYANLMTLMPNDVKNNSSYAILNIYANKVPPSFNDLTKAFAEIKKNYSPTQQMQTVPQWLKKIAEFFKGEVKIAKGNSLEHSPIDAIKEALELRDFQLAADAAQYTDNASVKKWAKLIEDRINLEQHYQLLAEQISSITLAKKDIN